MAFDKKPSTWLGAGYTVASNKAQFNTASAGSNVVLEKVTDAEADPTTGDIRDVARALCYALFEAWSDQSPSNRPSKMTITKNVTVVAPTAANPQVLRESYSLVFDVTSDPQSVIDEP